MDSSINKLIVFLSIVLCSCANGTEPSSKQCVENVLQVKVVRVDQKNQRYFIAGSNVSAEDIATKTAELGNCFSDSSWKGNWSLSLFTDAKYAGYKDEKNIIPYHEDNSWAKAYVAEYDSQANTLISYPAYKPKQILP